MQRKKDGLSSFQKTVARATKKEETRKILTATAGYLKVELKSRKRWKLRNEGLNRLRSQPEGGENPTVERANLQNGWCLQEADKSPVFVGGAEQAFLTRGRGQRHI